jgi:DNA-directed RNA polymerase specialized sigma24 family protein
MRENESALAVCCQEITARLKRGEEASLEDFLRHLGPILAGQLRKRFGTSLTAEDIEDVLAETLYRVWLHREDYDAARAPFPLWCYLIARNVGLDTLREKARHKAALSALWVELHGRRADREALATGPNAAALERALSELPAEDRLILIASVRNEEDWAARLAAEMPAESWPTSNALRQRRFRAMNRLRSEMARLGFPC